MVGTLPVKAQEVGGAIRHRQLWHSPPRSASRRLACVRSRLLPPERHLVRRQGVFIPPLLIFPFLVYNILAFTVFGGNPDGLGRTRSFTLPMVSGQAWALTSGDLMLVVGLVVLFFEVVKSTQSGRSSVLEHMLSTLVFILFLVEFLLVGACASSVFFILMVMALFDVVAGFTVSITSAGRDVTMGVRPQASVVRKKPWGRRARIAALALVR